MVNVAVYLATPLYIAKSSRYPLNPAAIVIALPPEVNPLKSPKYNDIFKDPDRFGAEPKLLPACALALSLEVLPFIPSIKNITSLGTDVFTDYELSMSYNNQVELDDVTIDEDEIESIIKAVIEEHVDINEN